MTSTHSGLQPDGGFILDDRLLTPYTAGDSDEDAPDDPGMPLQTRLHAYEQRPSQYVRDAEKILDQVEQDAADNLFDALVRVRDTIKGIVLRDFTGRDASWVNRLNLSRWGAVQSAIGEMLRTGYRSGQLAARDLIKRHSEIAEWHEYRVQRTVGLTRMPRKGMEFMQERELFLSTALKDTLTTEMKNVLMQAMRNGENIEDTVQKITGMFEDLIGTGWVPSSWPDEKPARLQRLIRTNATDAYNHGVLTEFRDPDVLLGIVAIRYAAVLDNRTTDICRFLNGWLFKPLDPRLDQVLPPNHWNCRSIIEPIINKRQAPAELFVTDATIREAKSLIPVDFGGFK